MRSLPRLALVLAAAVVVVWLVIADFGRTSPGALSAVHAGVGGFMPGSSCDDCHGNSTRTMEEACLECHAPIAEQLAAGAGLHGTPAGSAPRDCAACHSEHHGKDFAIVSDRSFALAGFGSRDAFDHAALIEYRLDGRHARLDCAACHPHADVAVLAEGDRRFLGLDQDCTACHEDPHHGRMADACESCHGQDEAFARVAAFAHDPSFPLEGAHGESRCLDCHPKDALHSVEALAGTSPAPARRACTDCHADEHGADFLAAAARETGSPPDGVCASCHPIAHADFHQAAGALTPDQHASSGFVLETPHAGLACEACHADAGVRTFAERFPGRTRNACEACHADPHAGQFEGEACLACHAETAFVPHGFDAARHASTAFALTGAHARTDCSACHTTPDDHPGGSRRFRGTETACASCHADAHRGAFAPRNAAEAPGPAPGCEACHGTERFASVDRAGFAHADRTGFALHGAHGRLECEACHARAQTPDANGRRFGFAAAHADGGEALCSACHTDVHGGRFDHEGAPLRTAGGTDCARCHDADSFARVGPPAFDHAAWSGFALEGAHRLADCALCHGRSPHPDFPRGDLGRIEDAKPGADGACADCHADPHGGVIARATGARAAADCAACHTAVSFRVPARPFDHAASTGFELAGDHARLSCEQCHALLPAQDARGRSMAMARGRACTDCHADPHAGQFESGGATDCSRCHSEAGGFPGGLLFDHGRDSRFPLDETHRVLDCSACHKPVAVPGGRPVVRYRPLGTSCRDCHGFR